MTRLRAETARRVDRLAWRAHAFHRWAHHPLCGAYAGEVVRLGRRTRICRGCTLLALGAVGGAVLGLALPAPAGGELLAGLAVSALAAALALRRRTGRPVPKLLTRAVPVAALAFLFVAGLRDGTTLGVVAAEGAAAVLGAGVAYYRRRGPDRTPCAACPERPAGPACSGFREQVRRERAFSRRAGRSDRRRPARPVPDMTSPERDRCRT